MFYEDTAIFGSKIVAECGLKFFGVEKTLFGTDAPLGPKKTNGWLGMITEVLDNLDTTPDERRAIYEGNARRILKLK
jgi:predicted TIM-barrel fold metal-dependent hydrolase